MNQYYLELLGLRVLLQTPAPILISQRLQPFLCPPYTEPADCTIRINNCRELPLPNETGVWHGPECYVHSGDALEIFHCHKPHSAPFAVTQIEKKGDIHITVHPDCADYFSGSSGIFNRIGFENLLLQHHGLLLHASLIEYARKGIAFTGPSGVGKSTQAQLWHSCYGANILNGDRAALRNAEADWIAYGSPYAGTSGIYRNEYTPLAAIVVLRQGKENHLRRLSGPEAMMHIWPEISARRWDAAFVAEATDLCVRLLTDVPVYLLECLPQESAAALLKKGLSL